MTTFEAPLHMLQTLLWHPGTGVLVALLLVAAWTDWRAYRIPNWLTVSGMAWGLAYNSLAGNSVVAGFVHGLLGLVTGLALLLPLHALRVLGAGDVKLMAMVGAFLGALATLKAALIVFIIGGLLAVAWAAVRRSLPQLKDNTQALVASLVVPGMPLWRPGVATPSVGSLPYGISISLGAIVFVTLRQLGYI